MAQKNSRLQTRRRGWLRKYRWLIIALLVIIAILGALEWRGAINLVGNKKPMAGTIPSESLPSESSATEDKVTETPAETTPPLESPKQEAPAPTPSGDPPHAPYGNFVSNHSPNLDGSPNPSSITSACITSPGASCRIEFTNGEGVVKELKDQTTNSSGETSWVWDAKQAGFTPGSWKVKAIATLNGQTTSTEDVQSFEVGP